MGVARECVAQAATKSANDCYQKCCERAAHAQPRLPNVLACQKLIRLCSLQLQRLVRLSQRCLWSACFQRSTREPHLPATNTSTIYHVSAGVLQSLPSKHRGARSSGRMSRSTRSTAGALGPVVGNACGQPLTCSAPGAIWSSSLAFKLC
jgi:hypothetical protein